MFQVVGSWPDDDLSLGSKQVAIQIKLFTSELVAVVNIYRQKVCCHTYQDIKQH
jgi:hypothetical protein